MSVQGLDVTMSVFSVFLQPREEISVAVGNPAGLESEGKGVEQALTDLAWHIKAPLQPGFYPLTIRSLDGARASQLNVFVLHTLDQVQEGWLEGYRIGVYPAPNPKRAQYYPLPQGFVGVSEDMLDIQLTPHFTLRQFLCKQASAYPKFVVLREKLLYLLEDLLGAVNRAGYPAQTFGFISAYRTPWYNKSIGNVKYSRHVYGDAADIYLDVDGDGRMDDMDGDGQTTATDVRQFFDLLESYRESRSAAGYQGGMGLYKATSRHHGFVHVDTRGYRARW